MVLDGEILRRLRRVRRPVRRFITDYSWRLATPVGAHLLLQHERIVSRDHVLHTRGHRFHIPPQARRFSFPGAKFNSTKPLTAGASLSYGHTRLQHTLATPGLNCHLAVRVTNSCCDNRTLDRTFLKR